MSLHEFVRDFRNWGISLGCSPEKIPSEDALNSIFKSRQHAFICDLMKRVLPKQDVQKIRKQMLVKQMKNVDPLTLKSLKHSHLPKEAHLYLKTKELEEKIAEIEERLNTHERNCNTIATTTKSKLSRCLALEHKIKSVQAKINLLELKRGSTQKAIDKERENANKILLSMPTRVSAASSNKLLATSALEKSTSELAVFYDFCMKNSDPDDLKEAQTDLWQKLRCNFANIPNCTLFDAIMEFKEQHIRDISTMKELTVKEKKSTTIGNTDDNLSPFEVKLLTTKGKLLKIAKEYYELSRGEESIYEEFRIAYRNFVDQVEAKIKLFSSIDDDAINEDHMSNYIVAYVLYHFHACQNEHQTAQIEQLRAEIQNNVHLVEEHETLVNSLKDLYADISTMVNRVVYDIAQLKQIKQKIIYSLNMLKCMFSDIQQSYRLTNKPNLSMSLANKSRPTIESFDFTNGSLLCSTALDMDSSNMNMSVRVGANSTTMYRYGNNNAEVQVQVPPYQQELNAFAAIPFDKFNNTSKQCHFYLSGNPLIVELNELSVPVLQMAPGIPLTTHGALQEVRNHILWADVITRLSSDMKLNLKIVTVDEQSLPLKLKQQDERIMALFNNLNKTAINTQLALEKCAKLYDFILKNKPRYFIPSNKMVNNCTYADMEAEYNLYYRIVTANAAKDNPTGK